MEQIKKSIEFAKENRVKIIGGVIFAVIVILIVYNVIGALTSTSTSTPATTSAPSTSKQRMISGAAANRSTEFKNILVSNSSGDLETVDSNDLPFDLKTNGNLSVGGVSSGLNFTQNNPRITANGASGPLVIDPNFASNNYIQMYDRLDVDGVLNANGNLSVKGEHFADGIVSVRAGLNIVNRKPGQGITHFDHFSDGNNYINGNTIFRNANITIEGAGVLTGNVNGSCSRLDCPDTRSVNSPPSYYAERTGLTIEFKSSSVIGLPAGAPPFVGLETKNYFVNETAELPIQQTAIGSTVGRNGKFNYKYIRYGKHGSATWGPWELDPLIRFANNFNSIKENMLYLSQRGGGIGQNATDLARFFSSIYDLM